MIMMVLLWRLYGCSVVLLLSGDESSAKVLLLWTGTGTIDDFYFILSL